MARTRSKPSPKDEKEEEITVESVPSTTKTLLPSDANPPKLFVLPKGTSEDTRIVTLDSPSNAVPSRYLFCPEKGFFEFTRIAAPKKDFKSWLITGDQDGEDGKEKAAAGRESLRIGSGYVTKAADLFIATPIDLLFLILPALLPQNGRIAEQHYLPLDEHLDSLSSLSRQWRVLISSFPSLSTMIARSLASVCDSVEAGNETMYRISQEKLLAILLKKAERMCENGLPPSMEEKFVKSVLEVPVMSIRREESSVSLASEAAGTTPEIDSQTSVATQTAAADSQSSSTSSDAQSSAETVSTTATSITTTTTESVAAAPFATPPEIPRLLRLRTSLTYLYTTYLPPLLRSDVISRLSSPTCPVDFTPLTNHLSALAELRSKATALRSFSDNVSRKRGFEDDDEKVAEREEKKRKKEEDERKKKLETRGVKQLKKADTSGMKKLSAFFTKAPKKV